MAATDVRVASPVTGTGGILSGALSATPPTDETSTLSGFSALGYVGEDGLTMSTARSTERIRAWGGDTVRIVQTEHDVTLSWTFLETTAGVAEEVYGENNVTATPAGPGAGNKLAIEVTSETLPNKSYVFDMKDGDAKIRAYVPNGQITEVGDVQFVHSAALSYQVTLEAFPDEHGVKVYIYSDDGQVVASA